MKGFTILLMSWISHLVEGRVFSEEERGKGEYATFVQALEVRPLDHWVEVWENVKNHITQGQRFALDRKQILMNILSEMYIQPE